MIGKVLDAIDDLAPVFLAVIAILAIALLVGALFSVMGGL